jgi:hypothetical protein
MSTCCKERARVEHVELGAAPSERLRTPDTTPPPLQHCRPAVTEPRLDIAFGISLSPCFLLHFPFFLVTSLYIYKPTKTTHRTNLSAE